MIIQWFLSKTVRQAVEMRNHVRKLLRAQQDILAPPAIETVQSACIDIDQAIQSSVSKQDLLARMEGLETAANKWLRPYPHAAWRENVEVFLVAIAVAMGIRTFILQPFKIPTGSMQPTLYGITHENLKNKPDAVEPSAFQKFTDSCFRGISYYHVVAENDGVLNSVQPMQRFLLFNLKQSFRIGDQAYTVWFPPDQLFDGQQVRSGAVEGQTFRKGEDIIKLSVKSGDHLFVDRVTFNFRPPTRGEIIVFETRGIPGLPQDQFYIKRLVALGGEKVRIGNDHHLVIDGKRLDASTPRFENVYTFGPEYKEGEYFGHVNDTVGARFRGPGLAPLFQDENAEFVIGPHRYMTMGDNTMNSLDSRAWGDFSRENVIGKSCFVYWPISSRFGWSHR